MALHRNRHSAVNRDLIDDRAKFIATDSIVDRSAEMQAPFVHTIEGCQHGEVQHASGFSWQGLVAPHPAPTVFGQ